MDNKLQETFARSRAAFSDLEREISQTLSTDYFSENERLRAELSQIMEETESLRSELALAKAENERAAAALRQAAENERNSIINAEQSRYHKLFADSYHEGADRLTRLNEAVYEKLGALRAELSSQEGEETVVLRVKTETFLSECSERLEALKKEELERLRALKTETEQALSAMKRDEITPDKYPEPPEQARPAFAASPDSRKKISLEDLIGGKLINNIGIFLLALAVLYTARLPEVPSALKGFLMFAFSISLIASGEILTRKKPTIFSLGLMSGGVACTFVSTALCFFMLHILSSGVSVFLCLLTTALAFVFATRHKSQVVVSFALIGGVTPLLYTDLGESAFFNYAALIYLTGLGLFSLITLFRRRWRVPMFIGFFLNLAAGVVCVSQAIGNNLPGSAGASAAFIIGFFATYTALPLAANYHDKSPFKAPDIALLAMNTFFSGLFMYTALVQSGFKNLTGLMAVLFAAAYAALGQIMERLFLENPERSPADPSADFDGKTAAKRVAALFYITGAAFVVLVVPLQFGREWLSLGWLAEGLIIALFGIIKEQKLFRRAGMTIFCICVAAFLLGDLTGLSGGLFPYKYFAVTAGSVLICAAYTWKGLETVSFPAFRFFAALNLWFYSLYAVYKIFELYRSFKNAGSDRLLVSYSATAPLMFAAQIAATAGLSMLLMSKMRSGAIKRLAAVMAFIAALSCLLFSGASRLSAVNGKEAAAFVLIAVSVISVISLKNAFVVLGGGFGALSEKILVTLSVYSLLTLTAALVSQYDIELTNAVISIIYIAASFGFIAFGFARGRLFLRRFGLGLSVLALVKLFLIDLRHLTPTLKVAAYFAFGVILMAESYIYGRFSKYYKELDDGGEGGENND
ncbi:MAG: DUF2339 domain-containing protein [Clostridiales bacterium]|jgi:hypothetical protein|nr:DUF2339 domain-containing protein [Clostridiales bacterium]